MRIKGEIINDILVQLGVSTTVAFYTDTIMEDWVDKAHIWAAGVHKWPFTEGRLNTTYVEDAALEVGFVYPEGWKADSIRLLQVGGKRFKKLNFQNYQEFREEFPDDSKKVFSEHGRLYFINPNADVAGTTTLWGQFTPAALAETDNTVLTVFSDVADEGNEAIIEEVLSYAKKKQQKLQEALVHHQRAQQILEEVWKRIQDEQFAYQNVEDEGLFSRIDVLGGTLRDDSFKRNQWF